MDTGPTRRGVALPDAGPDEDRLTKRVGALRHLDDRERLSLLAVLGRGELPAAPSDERERRFRTMIVAALVGEKETLEGLGAAEAGVAGHPAVLNELTELADLLEDRAPTLPMVLSELPEVPLEVQATYTRNEIAEAFDLKGAEWITWVRYDGATGTDLLLVTLNKTEQLHPEHDVPRRRHLPRPVPLGIPVERITCHRRRQAVRGRAVPGAVVRPHRTR